MDMECNSWTAETILPPNEMMHSCVQPNHLVARTYLCNTCQQTFSDKDTLLHHEQHHTEEVKLGNCQREINSKDQSKSDSSLTTSISKFTCAICLLTFPNDISLISHVSSHSNEEPDSKMMSASIKNFVQVNLIVSNDSSSTDLPNMMFACAICNKSFSSDRELMLHVKGHSTECDIKVTLGVPHELETLNIGDKCTSTYTPTRSPMKSSDLEQTITSVLPYSSKKIIPNDIFSFQCTICKKYFKNAITLKSHMRQHDESIEATIEHKSQPQIGIEEHLEQAFSRVKNQDNCTLKCAICSKLFTNDRALISHVNQHAINKQHECETCHKKFKCQSHLSRHERVHSGVRPFGCPVCPSAFMRRSHLSTHLRLHRGERPFPCTSCDKTFTDGSNLAKHLRIHSQEKSHRCEICNRVFGRSDTLAKHRRSHSGAKPYQCQLCARFFPRQDSLARHLKSHRGERPHQCIICSKAFTQKYDLTLHYRTHARTFTLRGGWGLDTLSVPELPLPATQ